MIGIEKELQINTLTTLYDEEACLIIDENKTWKTYNNCIQLF